VVKSISKYFLPFIICIPLFLINVKSSHDWGDDFAQYIHQALNIISGVPQHQTGYIYNPDYPGYAPPAYPVGFPLLLSPICYLWGTSIIHFNLYISLFLTGFAILLFAFLNRYYSRLISILLVFVFIYNPWILWFKQEVMSDIPFSFFFLLSILLYTRKKEFTYSDVLLLSLIAGFMISVRTIGIVFPVAVVIDLLISIYKNRRPGILLRTSLIRKGIMVVGSLLAFTAINKFFMTPADDIISYKYVLDFPNLKHFIQVNLTYYTGVMRAFFEPWNDQWHFIAIVSGTMLFAFAILGIIKKITSGLSFTDWVFFIYLLIIVVYPYSNAGFRFLLPLAPMILNYIVVGILSINIDLGVNTRVTAVLF
jgi:hypothetical protein